MRILTECQTISWWCLSFKIFLIITI